LSHLGGSFSRRGYIPNELQDPVRYRAFDETRVGRYRFADTGDLFAEGTTLAGLEFAFQFDSFCFQSEYTHVWVRDAVREDRLTNPSFHGWYVQASYFLTGENRTYRRFIGQRTVGVFDRARNNENFFLVRRGSERFSIHHLLFGRGAWEVAARFTSIDLNNESQGVEAQTLRDVTLGLNWYLNMNTKIQANYILLDRRFPAKDNSGVAHVFAWRFHYDF
jgi:phosphate-selective porin OprO/OprP